MPLTPAEAKEVKRLLQSGIDSRDPSLDPFVSKVQPELTKELPAGHGLQDEAMRRFLIARSCVVDGANGAKEMILATIAWRQATLPVTLTPEVKDELRKGKFFPSGRDAEGNPLIVVRSCNFDPKERNLDHAISAATYAIEEAVSALPKQEGKFSLLYDRKDFKFGKNWDFQFLKGVALLFSAHYPERLAGAYLYPSGLALPALWGMVSVFLDPRTRAKVRLINDPQELQTYVPIEHIPKWHGGHSDCELDPGKYES